MAKQTHKVAEEKETEVKHEVPVKQAKPEFVTVHVPFEIHINGEKYVGNCNVKPDVAEVLIEMVQRRKANELAAVEGRIKNILRSADGAIIIQDKGSVNGGKI